MTRLFRISDDQLVESRRKALELESKIEGWVARDLSLVGLDGLVIGRQTLTDHGKRIDILAMDEDGNLVIIELKRDKSPRDIVGQALDYASWVCRLSTNAVHELAQGYLQRNLAEAYRETFAKSIPDVLNATHQMIIVASEIDDATQRIIEYLSEQHGVGINASFFNVFEAEGQEWLTTDHLLDQEEVKDRSTKKARPPWSGLYYVTGGAEVDRPWDPMRRRGFFSASGGRWYTDKLDQLSVGDRIFYYQKNNGYLGYGCVTAPKRLATEFELPSGQLLTEAEPATYLTEFADDPDNAAYAVGVDWIKTFDRDSAQTFAGIFANQNIVCKLYHAETVDFLKRAFKVEDERDSVS